MNKLSLNHSALNDWFSDNGDATHNLNYALNENSIVIDLGGYTGIWAQQIISKYNPNVYIIEPLKEYYDLMVNKFHNYDKVKILNVGVSNEDKMGLIYLNGDASSSNLTTGKPIDVEFCTIETILNRFNISEVDLIQINIEGDEYLLLEHMIETGTIKKFKNIQIQFHLGIENDVERRNKIREDLIGNNFKIKFDYPFVWESWEIK